MKNKLNTKNSTPLVLILGALSLAVYLLAQLLPSFLPSDLEDRMTDAARIMVQAGEAIRQCRREAGVSLNQEGDINLTGFIGLDFSLITTSIGSLPSKRTSTNPNFGALLVYLLSKAGVEEGDSVAIGASGSFPALIVASLSACRAMGLRPLLICSLGASQWGANHPDFHLLHMWDCLKEKGLFRHDPVVWSLGGDRDIGLDMDPAGRAQLLSVLEARGVRLISNPDLAANIEERIKALETKAGGEPIKAFINVGGSWANLGTDDSILQIDPGLSFPGDIPVPEKRGMIQEAAARGIPVIHCLYISGLARKFGLPWDPSPLPEPGEGGVFRMAREERPALTSLYIFYILVVVLISVIWYRPRL